MVYRRAVFVSLGSRPHGHDRFYFNLIWAISQTSTFLLWGVLLFGAFWGLRHIGAPIFLLRILGALAAPSLAILISRHSFFGVLNSPGYYFVAPMIFLAIFILCAAVYGAVLLPRILQPGSTPHLHIHFLVLALFVPYVPLLILHAANPQLPFPTSSARNISAPHYGQIVFARWTPGSEALAVEPFHMHLSPQRGGLFTEPADPSRGFVSLNDDEIRRLRSAGITGSIKVLGSAPLNDTGRLVLIMSQQIAQDFQFATPAENAQVIYIQGAEGWRKLPPEAREAKSTVRMYVPEQRPDVTGFEIKYENGRDYRDETCYLWP